MDLAFSVNGFLASTDIELINAPKCWKKIAIFFLKRANDFDYCYQSSTGKLYSYKFEAPKEERNKLTILFFLRD